MKLGEYFNHLSALCAVSILNAEEEERLGALVKVVKLAETLKKVFFLSFFFFKILLMMEIMAIHFSKVLSFFISFFDKTLVFFLPSFYFS